MEAAALLLMLLGTGILCKVKQRLTKIWGRATALEPQPQKREVGFSDLGERCTPITPPQSLLAVRGGAGAHP